MKQGGHISPCLRGGERTPDIVFKKTERKDGLFNLGVKLAQSQESMLDEGVRMP